MLPRLPLRLLAAGLVSAAAACSEAGPPAPTAAAPDASDPAAAGGIDLAPARSVPAPRAASPSFSQLAAAAVTVAHSVERQTTQTRVTIFFEGLPNKSGVPTTARASFPYWEALIDAEGGGTGNFANEPSPSAALFWNGNTPSAYYREITFSQPVAEVSLWYAGCLTCGESLKPPIYLSPFTLTAFDRNGVAVDSVKAGENHNKGKGDPTGDYNRWDRLTVRAGSPPSDNVITRVRITGFNNYIGIDDLFYRQINFRPISLPGGPYAVDEGQPVHFSGSSSYDPVDASGEKHPDRDPLASFTWSFGDGQSAAGSAVSYTYPRSELYEAQLTVLDANQVSHTASVPVLVRNLAPVVNAGPDHEIQAGDPLTLSVGFTDQGGSADAPWSYSVDWGDGNAPTTGSVGSLGSPFTVTYPHGSPGSGNVVVSVEDRDGGIGRDTVRITSTNQPPTASFVAPAQVSEGATVAFDGSASGDADTGPSSLSFAWTFGDGATATGREPTHSYADDGTYTVTLRTTDPQGAVSAPATRQVRVVNVAPALAAVASVPVAVAVNGSWQREVSFSDPGRDSWTATVSYGTGTPETIGIGVGGARTFTVGRPYPAGGTYTVTIEVEDDDGGEDGTTFTVVANGAPAILAAGATPQSVCVAPGQAQVTLAATATDPDGDPLTLTWQQGSSVLGTGAAITRPFPLGSHSVLVVAQDDKGAQASRQVDFQVRDATPPTASLSATPGSLWPPNHKYREIVVHGTASDDCAAAGSVQWGVGYVQSNEKDNQRGSGSGNTTGDIRVTRPDGTVLLSSNENPRVPFRLGDRLEVRAERYGTAAPRVYTIQLTARDAAHNEVEVSAAVRVNHSRK